MIKVKENNLIYELNEVEKIASLIGNDLVDGNILIPKSIIHENQEFFVTSIKNASFANNSEIESISFPPDSEVQAIEIGSLFNSFIKKITIPLKITKLLKYNFYNCLKLVQIEFLPNSQLQIFERGSLTIVSIWSLSIPSSVIEFESGWNENNYTLSKMTIDPKNKRYKNYEEDEKLILGKSDIERNEYDIIVFAFKNIKKVTIPSNIKKIASYSFSICRI